MSRLYDQLILYADSDYYGFHMPGHKRNEKITRERFPYKIDITEIEEFDDLHHARGILQQAQERAAKIFSAEETCFLINGSTSGILASILGSTQMGDQILVARNCHKSVYHAIELNDLKPVYLYPVFDEEKGLYGSVKADEVRHAFKNNPEIRAVVLTSPTYDGIVSDINEIADIVHEYGISLIVDSAHGAHFGFHSYFPDHVNTQGADLVINSVHKTLPALTQTALLHMNGPYADREEVKKYLHMVQSSSPSYILMASIDSCVFLLEEKKNEIFDSYVEILKKTRRKIKHMKYLQLIDTDDLSKVVISVDKINWTGKELYQKLLKEYHLQMEMAAGNYVLGMTSVGDTKPGMDRLADALLKIDNEIENHPLLQKNKAKCEDKLQFSFKIPRLEQVYTSAETNRKIKLIRKNLQMFHHIAQSKQSEVICMLPWKICKGCISAEYAYLYPPGIPLIVPGERISSELIELLEYYQKAGFEIEGLKENGKIEVLSDAVQQGVRPHEK